MWILSSVISTRPSATAIQHKNLLLILIPTFNFCIFSNSSSIIKLNKNGGSGQPCFTLAFILISLVTLPPTVILVLAFSYISIIVPLTRSGVLFLLKPFSILLWDTVSNAFAKSRNTMLRSFLLFLSCLIICCNIFTSSKPPSTGTKPFCLSSKEMFCLSLLSHNLAYNRMNMLPTVIGLQFLTWSRSLSFFGNNVVLHSSASLGIIHPHQKFKIAVMCPTGTLSVSVV